MTFRTLAATAATALALISAPLAPALAQDSAPTVPNSDVGEVSDEMVTAFVRAAIDVNQVAMTYQGRINDAADDSARAALAEEAQTAMVGAVEEADGISVDEYVAITQAASEDEALNARLSARLEELAPDAS